MEIALLGEVTARAGSRWVDLGPPRQRCVLAALAVDAGRLVPADRLVVRVGGGDDPGCDTGQVRSVSSNRCLDVPNSSTTVGTPVQIWDCHGQTNQQWVRTSSGELTVYSGGSARCLDTANGGTSTGTAVVIANCNGGNNQKWNATSSGTITNGQSGLCLDVNGAATANGTAVIVWTCNGQTNQQWN